MSFASSMALPLISRFMSAMPLFGRLDGGEGRLPTNPPLPTDPFDIVFRRPGTLMFAIGTEAVLSPSRRAAVRAAMLALGLLTDFRRVTRWFGLRELVSSEWEEWELLRAWDCRPGRTVVVELESEGRCVNGLAVCVIS
jgi:hypothetical protein